jgi:hypothetical protein
MYSPSEPAIDVWGWFPVALFGLLAALMLPTSIARAHVGEEKGNGVSGKRYRLPAAA